MNGVIKAQAETPSVIKERFESMASQIDDLEDAVATLANVLDPVLSPDDEGREVSAESPSGLCALAQSIDGRRRQIADITCRIRALIERIQL